METTSQAEPTAVRISRYYPVAPEKVWRAWTEPEALSQWFARTDKPMVTSAEIDLRVGGRYRIAFSSDDGERHDVSGVYQEVVPHTRLVFTWAFKSTPERVSRISIDLHIKGEGTELSFVHDRFFNEQARVNHERGWTAFFIKLDELLNQHEQAV